MWVVIGSGMIILLAAAMRKEKSDRCSNYTITIKGATENLFVTKEDVAQLIASATGGRIKGQSMSAFDLRKLEKMLENNAWIKGAEMYFDNKETLHVTVTEREPLARVFTTAGKTFYIDADQKQMAVSDKLSAKLPVFTGFPEKKKLTAADSVLLRQVRDMAAFIQGNLFWKAQVAQVDITIEKEFEIVPVVGNHIVKLGKGEDIEKKFHRLFVFYKEVLSKTGFDTYKTIDVQYAGQVVGVKGATSKGDIEQSRKNIDKLMQLARDMDNQEMILPPAPSPAQLNPADTIETNEERLPAINNNNEPTDPNPLKLSNDKPVERAGNDKPVKPVKQTNPKPVKTENRTPKAVMPKSTRESEYEVQQ
jgi:cell division protein FtsQ